MSTCLLRCTSDLMPRPAQHLAAALLSLALIPVSFAQSISFTGGNLSNLSGGPPTWTGTELWVGNYYGGTLTIADGANVVVNSWQLEMFVVGNSGSGTMVITGSGSKAISAGVDFHVGLWSGTGTVHIENGGVLETNSIETYVGYNVGDNGSVLVTGAGSAWFANAGALVGFSGTGTLTIANSGAVVIGEARQIYLGDGAPGTLNIGAYDGTTTGGTVTGGITAYGNGVINFNQTDAFTLDGALTSYEPGSGSLVQRGSGTTTLTNAAGFSGTTTIEAGRLIVNTSLADSTLSVGSAGTLAGTGTVGTLTIADGATIAPGNSPGTLNAGNTTFGAGGNYSWEINDAEGSAGTNWDFLNITGTLTITATAMDPFVIELISLLGDNSAGALANFDAAQDYSYTIATASGGITGFSADAFSVSTAGFVNNLLGGAWSLAQAGNSLNLNFTASAVPEPSTYAALAGLLALGFAFWRKRRQLGGA